MGHVSSGPLYLCAGLQSSGSTLLSWCFLQRRDMDGVLDSPYHTLPEIPSLDRRRLRWFKKNIAVFRATEVQGHFADFGWTVRPLLVVRDVRSVWNSLCAKHYGRNGTTAEDPPLRTRFRRFLDDWREFRAHGQPVVRFETLLENPKGELQRACEELDLDWDEAMVTWPKPASAMLDAFYGNATFHRNRRGNLFQSLGPAPLGPQTENIAPGDLRWLEHMFAEFLEAHKYGRTTASTSPKQGISCRPLEAWFPPSFKNTKRYRRLWPWEALRRWIVTRTVIRALAIRIQSRPRFPRRGAREL